jgi:hypothetical protein
MALSSRPLPCERAVPPPLKEMLQVRRYSGAVGGKGQDLLRICDMDFMIDLILGLCIEASEDSKLTQVATQATFNIMRGCYCCSRAQRENS